MIDFFRDFLIAHGPIGMFISAFLAGSFLPFNSELIMAALYAGGASPRSLLVAGSIGNIFGSVFNYFIGTMGNEEWILRYTKTPPNKLERGKRLVHRYGGWAGLLAWIPLLGSLITVALGFLHVNMMFSFTTISIGKIARYALVLIACGATLW